ncbi:hypothetical protein F4776DRAFT_631309 [Hypoxylon sp. NC0597]|nr:hypothetical protein F4776DRAFT_631309 [Hypoxylon sp. NC0597]
MDVTSFVSIKAAFDEALKCFGRVDVVVNNAGYTLIGDAESSPPGNTEVRALFDTNFWGAVDVTKCALSIFRDINPASGQQGGVIVNVTCMGGFLGSPGSAFYNASKFALEGFAESVAKEVAPEWNIHVVNVEPGAVRTNHTPTALERMQRHLAYVGNPNCATNRMLGSIDDVRAHGALLKPEEVAEGIYMVVESVDKILIRVPLGRVAWDAILEEARRTGLDWVLFAKIMRFRGRCCEKLQITKSY